MADNVAVTAGSGTNIAADELTDATLGSVKVQFIKLMDGTLDGSLGKAAVKAGGTLPNASTDGALVVTIRDINANVNADSANSLLPSAPVASYDYYGNYETVAASQTDQVMGSTGAAGNYLAGVLIVPGTTAAGAVSIKDGAGSAISIFAGGGTTALTTLIPFFVPLGIYCATSWKITTGTNVTAIGVGRFT